MRTSGRARGPGASDASLRALWDDHAPALLTFALHLTGGDQAAAEDVVQETLVRAWQHLDALDSNRGGLRPWLFTVARRITIDQYRARRARPTEADSSDLALLADEEDTLDRALDSWVVADALADLTPVHRDALVQTYFAGRTVPEAAAVLGIPPGTVKSRVFYGLRALKVALEERGMS